ncbi:hypothetical protein IQ264_16110 [Phormidium sp. LEGE 05292]|uniref:hypothetical protein n=1 Tax=[Phormidium] sp. LEGE 05292 TaxID=767427 RepID=UPI001880181C|nr:hypothetical protein [Phormidium sp. LEGE 05292]MBE9226953.1 hypothetical protein [Phormidium sp. LEGE 05292]
MTENLAIVLGELQAQIYWLHDAEKFTELAIATANIYLKLSYSHQQSATAGITTAKAIKPFLVAQIRLKPVN